MDEETVCGWTIYHRPSDFPNHFAVRMWIVVDAGDLYFRPVAVLCDSLDEARAEIPVGAICFPREPTDDLVIVESWL